MNAAIESKTTSLKHEDHDTKIESYLLNEYGPWLSIIDVSELIKKSPETIKKYLTSKTIKTNATINTLREAKRRIGRTILFDALIISRLFSSQP